MEAPGAAAVHELQVGVLAHGRDRGRAPPGQLVDRAPLHLADHPPVRPAAGRGVAQAGDLRLVRHEADEPVPAAAGEPGGERTGLGGGVHRGAAYADVRPPTQRSPGGVQLQAEPQFGAPARRGTGVHQVELGDVVDHDRDRAGELVVAGEFAQRGEVGGRVRDQHVAAQAGAYQPDRLGQRVRHDPGIAGPPEYVREQPPAADRLAGHPDRLAPRPADERGRVRVEGVRVHDRERWVEVGGGPVEAGPVGGSGGGVGGHDRTVIRLRQDAKGSHVRRGAGVARTQRTFSHRH